MSSGIIQTLIQASDLFFEITSNQTNLDIRTLIGDTLFNAEYRKRVLIPSAVTIGSPSTANAALKIPTGLGGSLFIDNYGSIQGAGGAAGGAGGDAILAQSTCTIENKPSGTIYAGGGGGGTGGTGGQGGAGQIPGSPTTIFGTNPCSCRPGTFSPSARCRAGYVTFVSCNPPLSCPPPLIGNQYCSAVVPGTPTPTTGGAGGAGGGGGVGRGYNQSPTTGSAGSAGLAGGTNAGTGGAGGTGGTGGDWGAAGATGDTGATGSNGNVSPGLAGLTGSAGGAAGNYINGSPFVTFINTGLIAGSII